MCSSYSDASNKIEQSKINDFPKYDVESISAMVQMQVIGGLRNLVSSVALMFGTSQSKDKPKPENPGGRRIL